MTSGSRGGEVEVNLGCIRTCEGSHHKNKRLETEEKAGYKYRQGIGENLMTLKGLRDTRHASSTYDQSHASKE